MCDMLMQQPPCSDAVVNNTLHETGYQSKEYQRLAAPIKK